MQFPRWSFRTISACNCAHKNIEVKNFVIAAIGLATIGASVTYAYKRETLRKSLPELYRETNEIYFQGELPIVPTGWSDLSDADTKGLHAQARTKFDHGKITMEFDRKRVTDIEYARKLMHHESCHIFVDMHHGVGHGEEWQACMKRFGS
jgi:hypothetical protein